MQEIMHGITVDPLIKGGKPVIKGTRVPVELILGKLAAGLSYEETMSEYELTKENIFVAMRYVASILSDERIRLVQENQRDVLFGRSKRISGGMDCLSGYLTYSNLILSGGNICLKKM